jgi:hypothetical protein
MKFFSLTLVNMDVVAKETTIVPWQFAQINKIIFNLSNFL